MSKSGITLRYPPITDSARVAYASSFQRVLTRPVVYNRVNGLVQTG